MIPQDDGSLTKALRFEFGKDLAVPILKVLVPKLTPTLTFDETATKQLQRTAIENVEPVVDEYAANSLVVRPTVSSAPNNFVFSSRSMRRFSASGLGWRLIDTSVGLVSASW